MPTNLEIYHAIDFEPGCADRMERLGMSRPKTLGDVWRAHMAAYEALSDAERARVDEELRIEELYMASACKGGFAPKRPAKRYAV